MKVTVTIPVGPHPANTRWLIDAVKSAAQPEVDEILLIDDMANLDPLWEQWYVVHGGPHVRIWRAPWRLGIATAFNFGVVLAKNECVYMLGSDDWLEPDCIERCVAAYESHGKRDGYYYTTLKYHPNGEMQNLACNAAMVTKGLWWQTGGFAVESGVGAPDVAFISVLMTHFKEVPLVRVEGRERSHLYNYRDHDKTDSSFKRTYFGTVIGDTVDMITRTYKKPEWTERIAR